MDFIDSSSAYSYREAAQSATSTLSGTVNGIIDDNDFFLGTGSGNVVIDMGSISLSQIGLVPGEVVSVGVREFDQTDVDAATLTRANGSIVQVPPGNDYSPPPVTDPLTGTNFGPLQVPAVVPGQTVTGTVETIVDDDDFILNYGFGRSLVDLGPVSIRQTGLTPGESISITVREADSQDIEAASITRSNGFTVQVPRGSDDFSDDFRGSDDFSDDFGRGSSEPTLNPGAGTNFGLLQVPAVVPGQTVTGTVETIVDDDDFILNYGFGRSLVDLGSLSVRQTGLTPGESISMIVREADSQDIEPASITRSNGFTVQVPPDSDDFSDDFDRGSSEPTLNPGAGTNFGPLQVPAVVPGQTVTGTVETIVDDDDFILNYGFGRSLVDLGSLSVRQTGLTPGESISMIVREADSQDIEPASITRSNGFTVQVPPDSDDFSSSSSLDDRYDDDRYDDDRYDDDRYDDDRDDDGSYDDDSYDDDSYDDDSYDDDRYDDDRDDDDRDGDDRDDD